jgi:catechol 2,3-dioxygenase-like lactoylglutathione lyase family enzyme
MLSAAEFVAFGAISDAARARAFYCGILGLQVREETEFALVLDANGVELRLQKVGNVTAADHTQLGWQVAAIAPIARQLVERGVVPKRYSSLEQDEWGIWTSPGGAQVLWFADPDGNLLSLTQMKDAAP